MASKILLRNWCQCKQIIKSKTQKTVAWIFLGSGAAIFAGGLITNYNQLNNPHDFDEALDPTFGADEGAGIAALGLLVAGGSIPFFIISSKNKKKAHAASVFIIMEKTQVSQGPVFNKVLFPAVGVKYVYRCSY